MVFDVSVALTWILFLALFPIAFFWLRRVWRIIVKRDFSEVALKRGESPANPARYAPFAAAINFIGGIIIVFVIFGVVSASLDGFESRLKAICAGESEFMFSAGGYEPAPADMQTQLARAHGMPGNGSH